MNKQTTDCNLPVHTVRHRNLKAAIWRNQTEKGAMFNVTVTRSYRDKADGKWHDMNSFGYDDLMNVAALMSEAHAYISNLKAQETRRVNSQQRPTSTRASGNKSRIREPSVSRPVESGGAV